MMQSNRMINHASRSTVSVLMPLPDLDFDPTESAIPWMVCTFHGWVVTFSTEQGNIAQADLNKLKGPLPGLMSASKKAQAAYQDMSQDQNFQHPIPYADIDPDDYAALLLPGGDAPGMRQYLESPVLQHIVLQFWQKDKLIGAICHGLLVLARTIDPQTKHSILYGHKVTALPKSLDRFAFRFDNWFLRHGYIMYSSCVADEVCACLEYPGDYSPGPNMFSPYAVSDDNLVTARWYLDAEIFAQCFANELQRRIQKQV